MFKFLSPFEYVVLEIKDKKKKKKVKKNQTEKKYHHHYYLRIFTQDCLFGTNCNKIAINESPIFATNTPTTENYGN